MSKKLNRIIHTLDGVIKSNIKLTGDKIFWLDVDGGYYSSTLGSKEKTLIKSITTSISGNPNPVYINGNISNNKILKVYDNNGLNVTDLCTYSTDDSNFTWTNHDDYVEIEGVNDGMGVLLVSFNAQISKSAISLESNITTNVKITTSNITTTIILTPSGTTISNPYLTGYTYSTVTGQSEAEVISACTWLTGPWTWEDVGVYFFSGTTCPCTSQVTSGPYTGANPNPTPITLTGSSSGDTFDIDWFQKKNDYGDQWYEFMIITGNTSGSTGLTWSTGITWHSSGETCCNTTLYPSGCTHTGTTHTELSYFGSNPNGLFVQAMYHCWIEEMTPSVWYDTTWYASGATGVEVNSGFSALNLPVIVTNQTGTTLYTGITVSLESGNSSLNFNYNPWFGDLLIYSINSEPIENGIYIFKFTHTGSDTFAYYTLILK